MGVNNFEMKYPWIFIVLLCFCPAHSSPPLSNEEEDIKRSQFPDGFFFGASTSSYQIEGAYVEDGKGLNNWDVFNHRPANIDGDNGDIADDHYHLYLSDIEIQQTLGVNAYRFSISWARVLPRGRYGQVNHAGISFYNKIIDNLLLKGIEPFVTIYHHDFPQELEYQYGSWLSPLMQEDFVHFAEICFANFGDRVKYWVTINEPNLFTNMAYIVGRYPPAHCSQPFGNCSVGNSDIEPIIAMHNLLLAHAKAVKLYREQFQATQGGEIGIVEHAPMFEPMTENVLDQRAAHRALAFQFGWTFDPLVFGYYPPEMRHHLGDSLPTFSPEEVKLLRGSIDFIGINHYTTLYAEDCLYSNCTIGCDRAIRGFVSTTGERNGIPIGDRTSNPSFFVVPRGMESIVNYVKNRYGNKPMYILENGFSPQEKEDMEESLDDVKRIEFYRQHLAYLARAMRNGADVRGHFAWSLMDNYEWVDGYRYKFGLYYVDRETLARIPRLSAKWYRNFLSNGSYKSYELMKIRSSRTRSSTTSGVKAANLDYYQ